ncbi:MAG: hypothetical protein GY781_20780, partial [Gammaproteobacteria bacterium]|nr:hypothetical protein [Gammaproteobacteria bacterium]
TTPTTEHDQIVVNGTTTISGALNPTIGYTPTKNDRIVILTATAISGTFSTVDPALPDDWYLDYSVQGEVALVYTFTIGIWDGGAGDNEWSTAQNWQGDILPGTLDDVIINNGDTVILSGTTTEIKSLTIINTSSLSISSGASLTVNGKNSDSVSVGITIGSSSSDTNASLDISGNLTLNGAANNAILSRGMITVQTGALLTCSGTDFSNQLNIQASGTVINSGSIILQDANSRAIVAIGTFTNTSTGIIDIDRAGYLSIRVLDKIFNNAGTINVDDAKNGIHNQGTINNQAGSTITITNATGRGVISSSTFTNAGTLTINGTAEAYDNNSSATFSNTGSLTGTGTFDMDGQSIDGTIIPGASPGKMTYTGNQTFTAASTLEIEVNGTTPTTEHDQIVVNGTTTISGALNPTIGYTPTKNDRIVILTATAISG